MYFLYQHQIEIEISLNLTNQPVVTVLTFTANGTKGSAEARILFESVVYRTYITTDFANKTGFEMEAQIHI